MMKRIGELKAENARLKAEVERLNTGIQPEGSNDAVGRAVNVLLEKEKEIARLKAEVERIVDERCLRGEGMKQKEIRITRLRAQVERLTKAGDAIISQWNKHGLIEAQLRLDWLAAKEGGQP